MSIGYYVNDEYRCVQPLSCLLNLSPPGQNGRHLADDIFICIFVNEKLCILIKISLKFIPKGIIDNEPTLI